MPRRKRRTARDRVFLLLAIASGIAFVVASGMGGNGIAGNIPAPRQLAGCASIPTSGMTVTNPGTNIVICGDNPITGPVVVVADDVSITCLKGALLRGVPPLATDGIVIKGARASVGSCLITGFKNAIFVEAPEAKIVGNTLSDNANGAWFGGGTVWPYTASRGFRFLGNKATKNIKNGVVISNLNFQSWGAEKGYITDNTIERNGQNGIYSAYSTIYVNIRGNAIDGNTENGISYDHVAGGPHIHFNSISGNAKNGIYLLDSWTYAIFRNTISGNSMHGISAERVNGHARVYAASNTISGNGINGVYALSEVPQTPTWFILNTNLACNIIENHQDSGIKIMANPPGVQLNTPVEAANFFNMIRSNTYGIYLDVQPQLIQDPVNWATFSHSSNVIKYNQWGAYGQPQGKNKFFWENTFYQNGQNAYDLAAQPTDYWDSSSNPQSGAMNGNWWSDLSCIPSGDGVHCANDYYVPPLSPPPNVDQWPLINPFINPNFDPLVLCQDSPEPQGPTCGDGAVNQPAEQCDPPDDTCPLNTICNAATCQCAPSDKDYPGKRPPPPP